MRDEIAPFLIILTMFFVAGTIVAISLVLRFKQRELEFRERLALIEKGGSAPPAESARRPAPWTPRVYLHRGLTWLFTGIALVVFLFGISLSPLNERPAADRVWRANDAKLRGATDDQVREIMNDRNQGGLPPAFALIGLIPIGVGLAHLITYRTERSAAPTA